MTQPVQTALLDNAENPVVIRHMSTDFDSMKTVDNESGKKPNIFQRMFQKLDDKMKQKAEESESCCCGCNEEKKPEKESEKCC